MNREEFKKKVEQELTQLNKEQVVHFAWRCAVRALPSLGSEGSFNFWDKKNRQQYAQWAGLPQVPKPFLKSE